MLVLQSLDASQLIQANRPLPLLCPLLRTRIHLTAFDNLFLPLLIGHSSQDWMEESVLLAATRVLPELAELLEEPEQSWTQEAYRNGEEEK